MRLSQARACRKRMPVSALGTAGEIGAPWRTAHPDPGLTMPEAPLHLADFRGLKRLGHFAVFAPSVPKTACRLG